MYLRMDALSVIMYLRMDAVGVVYVLVNGYISPNVCT